MIRLLHPYLQHRRMLLTRPHARSLIQSNPNSRRSSRRDPSTTGGRLLLGCRSGCLSEIDSDCLRSVIRNIFHGLYRYDLCVHHDIFKRAHTCLCIMKIRMKPQQRFHVVYLESRGKRYETNLNSEASDVRRYHDSAFPLITHGSWPPAYLTHLDPKLSSKTISKRVPNAANAVWDDGEELTHFLDITAQKRLVRTLATLNMPLFKSQGKKSSTSLPFRFLPVLYNPLTANCSC